MAERFALIFVGVGVTLIVSDVYRQAATRLRFWWVLLSAIPAL